MSFERLRDGAIGVLGLTHVSHHHENIGVRTIATNVVGGPLKFLLVAREENHTRAFVCELTSRYEAQAAGTTRDERHLSVKPIP